jgi:hypothetical protein
MHETFIPTGYPELSKYQTEHAHRDQLGVQRVFTKPKALSDNTLLKEAGESPFGAALD